MDGAGRFTSLSSLRLFGPLFFFLKAIFCYFQTAEKITLSNPSGRADVTLTKAKNKGLLRID
jgi:hypothetical protein